MILCAGEALIDMIPQSGADGKVCFSPHVGGSVFNTAIALGRLGFPAGMLTGISTDLFGNMLIDALQESHVDTYYVHRSHLPTTLAFLSLKNGHASYHFYDENTATRMLYPSDIKDITDEVHTLYFGGISLSTKPCSDTYTALMEDYAKDKLIMIDLNIRPAFVQDEEAYRQKLAYIIEKADILKVSEDDINWLFPPSMPPSMQFSMPLEKQIEHLRSRSAALILLTKGSEGAIAYTADGRIIAVDAEKVNVKDTIGAGDTFNAGLLAKLSELAILEKKTMQQIESAVLMEALQFATKVAGITVARRGANPPWKKEL